MRRSFDSQFNQLQVVLFCLLVVFALVAIAPQALALDADGTTAIERVDTVPPTTYLEWKAKDGSLSFTDREKHIPVLYRTSGAVIERKWSDLDVRVTISGTTVKPRAKKLPVPERAPDMCMLPTRMEREWVRSHGPENHMYRRLVTSVVEGCGTATYQGTASPRVELNR
jgi:hypothetical protein